MFIDLERHTYRKLSSLYIKSPPKTELGPCYLLLPKLQANITGLAHQPCIPATLYLDLLVEHGLLQKQKIGLGNYYINQPLCAILVAHS